MTKTFRRNNITLKKFNHLKNRPDPIKKGITISIEDAGSNGYIVKKYVNGTLHKEKFMKKNKLNTIIKKQIKKNKRKTAKKGGDTQAPQPAPAGEPQRVVMVDDTPLWTRFKQGMAEGAAFGLFATIFDFD